MGANDFESRGYALNATIANADGSSASVLANTPVAIAVIVAFTVLGVGAMLTQEHRLPQDPQLALAEGDDDGSKS